MPTIKGSAHPPVGKYFDREIIVFTSDHTKSPGLPWSGDPMKKSQCQSAWWNHSHMGHLKKSNPRNIIFISSICSPCCWMDWIRIKRIAGLAKKHLDRWLLTIILALVTDVIGVFEFVFDILFKNTDMPEKYELHYVRQTLWSNFNLELILPVPISPLLGVHHLDIKSAIFSNRWCWCKWFVGSWSSAVDVGNKAQGLTWRNNQVLDLS